MTGWRYWWICPLLIAAGILWPWATLTAGFAALGIAGLAVAVWPDRRVL